MFVYNIKAQPKINSCYFTFGTTTLCLSRVWLQLLAALLVTQFLAAAEGETEEESTSREVQASPEHFDGSETWYGVFEGKLADRSSLRYWHNELALPLDDHSDDLKLVVVRKGSVPLVLELTSALYEKGVPIEFSTGGSVHGHVVSKNGEPIKDATLTVLYSQQLQFVPPEPSILKWEANEDGSYRITGLPMGLNTISAAAPGFMPSQPEGIHIEHESQALDLDFRLDRAVHIAGRVLDTDESIVTGNVDASIDSEQQLNLELHFNVDGVFRIGPFAENSPVDLTARSPDGRRSEPRRVIAKTDAEADLMLVDHRTLLRARISNSETGELVDEFEFWAGRNNHVPALFSKKKARGQLDVEVCSTSFRFSLHAPGYSIWASNSISITGREEFDFGTIELDPLYEVSGRVVDAAAKTPIANARLTRTDGENYFASVLNLRTVRSETDDKGEFSFQGLPSSGGTILAYADGYRSVSHSVTNVEVPIDIELTPENQSSVEGTVFSAGGSPVAGAKVYLAFGIGSFGSGALGTQTDENGLFKFEGRDDGTYTTYAISDVGRSQKQTVGIENGQSVSGVKLVIETLGRIYGEVRGLQGGEGALVEADDVDSNLDENFSYELVGVSDGTHRVSIVTSESRRLSHSVDIVDGSSERVDFQFGESHTLSGVVVADGRPIAGVYLRAVSPEDRSMVFSSGASRHDGSFTLQGLAKGVYRILVADYGKKIEVEIFGDETRDIELGALSLSGKVVTPGEESLLQAGVILTGVARGERVRLYRHVGQSGRYLFDGLEAGKYTLTIEHEGFETLSRTIRLRSSKVDYDLHLTQALTKK